MSLHLKIALRHLGRRPVLNLIKILGMSLALSALTLILLFLKKELSYERHIPHAEHIYRFTSTSPDFFGGLHFARIVGAGYVPEMKEHFPGIDQYVRLAPFRGGALKQGDRFITLNQAFACDSTFLEFFAVRLLAGDPRTALDHPASMVITESYAQRVFGAEDPLGKVLTLPVGQYNGIAQDFTISGVMLDFPENSHLHPELVVSPPEKNWLDGWAWTYLRLSPNSDPEAISSGFPDFAISFFDIDPEEMNTTAHLQNIRDIHLHSAKTREIEANSNMAVIWSFVAAALVLLGIALVNFANLAMGMGEFSGRFLQIGQYFGAGVKNRMRYYMTESLLAVVLALLLSLLLSAAALLVIRKNLGPDLATGNILFMAAVSISFSCLAILTGLLPLFRQGRRSEGLSNALIVGQYAIAIMLTVAILVIGRQTNYALKQGLGSENKGLICLPDQHADIQHSFVLFKEEMMKEASVAEVSAMFEPPGGEANDMFRFNMEGYLPENGEDEPELIGVFPCDHDFAEVFDLQFLGGEDFSEAYEDHEGSGEYILNASAVRRLGYADPTEVIGLGFQLIFNEQIPIPEGRIIGVVEDFHLSSLKREVAPLVLFKRKDLWVSNIVIRPRTGRYDTARDDLAKVWERLFPDYPLYTEDVDTLYRSLYAAELLQKRLLALFTCIALFISSTGLLGLALLRSSRRIREIGIRKVNGATTASLTGTLNRDLLRWVLVAALPALPLSWLAMRKWLASYAYQVQLEPWIFLLAALLALLIGMFTVTLVTWRAARRNPVEALRYE